MKIKLANISELVEKNQLPEITNPVYVNADKTPTDDGIFSYKIFGRPGSKRRKLQFAYIDLGRPFLHPVAYRELCRICSATASIIGGTKTYTISSTGEIVEDEKGGTGLGWLYKNWEKIKFKDRDNKSRKNRIELLSSYDKNTLFCDKWITIPAFYYDLNFTREMSRITIDEIGDLYVGLLSKCQSLKNESEFFTSFALEAKVQEQLVAAYDYFIGKIGKKSGILHGTLLGKNTDYTSRGVITAESFENAQTYNDAAVKFEDIGVPLYQLASLALPFVSHELRLMLGDVGTDNFTVQLSKGRAVQVGYSSLSSDYAEKFVANFARTKKFREEEFFIKDSEGKALPVLNNIHYFESLGRPVTNTDVLYYIVKRIIKDKHILCCRYPLEDYRNVSFHRPVILTTEQTIAFNGSGEESETDYLYPDLKSKPVKWNDTIQIHPSVLEGMGADFDGDTVTLKLIFSKEANAEIENYIYSPKNISDLTGSISRSFGKEPILAMYEFTK